MAIVMGPEFDEVVEQKVEKKVNKKPVKKNNKVKKENKINKEIHINIPKVKMNNKTIAFIIVLNIIVSIGCRFAANYYDNKTADLKSYAVQANILEEYKEEEVANEK